MLKINKKIGVIFILIILISLSIYGLYYFYNLNEEVPKWKIGDTWIYNEYSHIESANDKPNVVGMYVEDIIKYKDQRFYVLSDFTPDSQKNVKVDTLNPINNDGSLILKRYDFPLKEGKEWEFKDEFGYKYKFKVVSIKNINVPAGNFKTFKIDQQMFIDENLNIKFINKYGGIKYRPYYDHKVYYYSPEVKNNVKVEWFKNDDLELHIELKSYSNSEFKNLIDSKYIGGPYNSTLEHWQQRMPNYYENNFNKWQDFYYLKFNKNGIEYKSYLNDYLLSFLNWLNNNSKSGDGVLCWWDYGQLINGYTDCVSIIDSPSKEIEDTIAEPWNVPEWGSNEKIVDVSNALLEPPDYTIDMLNKYNARYIMVDTSMFPFDYEHTGIFYAPVFAANENYYDYLTFELNTNHGMITDGEAESTIKEYSDLKIHSVSFIHNEKFFDSMFYHAYIGWDGRDVGVDENAIPGINDYDDSTELDNYYHPMQGWNLKNFKIVYRTAYWTPYNVTKLMELPGNEEDWVPMNKYEAINHIRKIESDGIDNDNNGQVDDRGEGGTWSPSYMGGGVFVLKYYEGAIINGIVRDSEGKPLENVRVTVQDEYKIPHDSVLTDENGYYNITTPGGELKIIASNGSWDEYSYSESRIYLTEKNWLNRTEITVSEDQAMRLTQDWIINDFDLIVDEIK